MNDHDKFKNIAAGIQSLIVSIGLIIGGIWTAYTFGITSNVVSLDLEVKAEQLEPATKGRPILLVKVIAKNNGAQPVVLDLTQAPLVIQKVDFSHPDKAHVIKTYTPLSYTRFGEHANKQIICSLQGVQSKATKVMTFIQSVDEGGTYFIDFKSPISTKQVVHDPQIDPKKAAERLGAKETGPATWGASTFFVVANPKTRPNRTQ